MIKYCLARNEMKANNGRKSLEVSTFSEPRSRKTQGYSQFQEWRKVAAQVVGGWLRFAMWLLKQLWKNSHVKRPWCRRWLPRIWGKRSSLDPIMFATQWAKFAFWNPSCTCAEELPVLLERKWLLYTCRGSPFEMINVTITIPDPFESHLLPCFLMLLYIKTWRKQRPKHPACCVAAVLVWELQVLVPAHLLAELAQLHGIHPILCNTLLCSHVRESCWRLTVQGIDLAWFSFIASCGLGIDFNWNRSQVLQLWTIVLTVLYEVCLRPAWGLSPEWKKMEKVESLQVCIRVKRLSFLSPRIKTDNHYQILDWFNLEGWYERRTGIHGVTESFAIVMPYHDWTSRFSCGSNIDTKSCGGGLLVATLSPRNGPGPQATTKDSSASRIFDIYLILFDSVPKEILQIFALCQYAACAARCYFWFSPWLQCCCLSHP